MPPDAPTPIGPAAGDVPTHPGTLNLQQRAAGENLRITNAYTESPEERQARLEREREDADHKRFKDRALFLVALALTVVVVGLSLYGVMAGGVRAEDRALAESALKLIVGGFVGFLMGRGMKDG